MEDLIKWEGSIQGPSQEDSSEFICLEPLGVQYSDF